MNFHLQRLVQAVLVNDLVNVVSPDFHNAAFRYVKAQLLKRFCSGNFIIYPCANSLCTVLSHGNIEVAVVIEVNLVVQITA